MWHFFYSKNQWNGKKCCLVRHAYCTTECCTNCHCPSTRSKTALLFPGLIASLQRIHVQYTALYWIQSVGYIFLGVETLVNLYFCGNICFAKQVIAHTEVTWVVEASVRNLPYFLPHYISLYLCIIAAFFPLLTLHYSRKVARVRRAATAHIWGVIVLHMSCVICPTHSA